MFYVCKKMIYTEISLPMEISDKTQSVFQFSLKNVLGIRIGAYFTLSGVGAAVRATAIANCSMDIH